MKKQTKINWKSLALLVKADEAKEKELLGIRFNNQLNTKQGG